jgi:hypothetical protein
MGGPCAEVKLLSTIKVKHGRDKTTGKEGLDSSVGEERQDISENKGTLFWNPTYNQ